MESAVTTDGLEWISEAIVGDVDGAVIDTVAVGAGTETPSQSDTALGDEIYRATDSDSNCTVEATTDTGTIIGRIAISGGTEVPAGAPISELGLFVDDGSTLVYRETLDPVVIASGNRKTFEFELTIQD